VGPRDSLDDLGEYKLSCLVGIGTQDRPDRGLVTILTELPRFTSYWL